MKKVLTVLLSLCLLVALGASFAMNSFAAEDIEVTVGQQFEWNDQSADSKTKLAWIQSKGVSPDGLWKYLIYAPAKKQYLPVVLATGGMFALTPEPNGTGLGYARARDHGKNFHPAEAGDIVKSFTFPSGGTVTVESVVARVNEWVNGTATPSSFAVYLEDKLVFPASGEYETLTSTADRTFTFDVEVSKGQRLYIHIGCVDGDQSGDAVNMSNTITYKAVNDSVFEADTSSVTTDTGVKITKTFTVTLTADGGPNAGSSDVDSGMINTNNTGAASGDGGSSVGLIIGIVAGVAVVAAVVVVIIVKKKK